MLDQESVSARMVYLAHEEIYRGDYTPPEEQVTRIGAVTHEQVAAAARRYLAPEHFVLMALGPAVGEPISERDWVIERPIQAVA